MSEAEGRPRSIVVLEAVIAAASLAYLLLYVAVALRRMAHPFELEWLEGGSLLQVQRILGGEALYARPSLAYVAFPYPPLYYYVAAAVARLLGPGFLALRLVSFLASVVALAAIFDTVRRETGRALPALLAAGAFAATYRMTGAWLDVGRVDSLFLALTLLAVHRIRFGRTALSQAAAGALLGLAFFAKQLAVVAVAGFALHHLAWRRRHAGALLGAAVAVLVGGTLLLDRWSGGWFTWHAFRPHGLMLHRVVTFFGVDLLPQLPIALLGSIVLLARSGRDADGRRFLATLAAVLLGTGLLGRMIVGAYVNALLPACAGLALMLGLAFHEARGRHAALTAAALLQLAMLAYDPRPFVPTAADRQAGERLTARLAALGGPVLVPGHPYLAARASGHAHAHAMAVGDLLHFAPGAAADAFEREMRRALCERRYSAVVTDGPWRYDAELLRDYGPPLPLPELGDAFFTVSGARTRPSALYLPRASGSTCRGPAADPAGDS